ncbi:DUF2029 domain-containing protein [bacterium]|nr:DUF2029 domain-containing protein [bacterium]
MSGRISRFNRNVLVFFLVNVVVLELAVSYWPDNPYRLTGWDCTKTFLRGGACCDSWQPMRKALELVSQENEKPLYSAIFEDHYLKFQYPLTSVLLIDGLERWGGKRFIGDALLNRISWYMVWVLIGIVLMINRSAARLYPPRPRQTGSSGEVWLTGVLIVLYALTFYPVTKGFILGQIQTWITLMFALAFLCWLNGYKTWSGLLIGGCCLIKPHFALLLVWGLMRKQWRFAISGLMLGLICGLVALGCYGLENNMDYLRMISFISHHGEAYFPNQSLNGLLNRFLFIGNNLEWYAHQFAPFNRWVYGASILFSMVLIGLLLFWRPSRQHAGLTLEYLLAALTLTVVSPVAWEHHYGILLVMFVFIATWAQGQSSLPKASYYLMAVAYFLSSNFFHFPVALASSRWNVVQSYLFVGALILLLLLYRLRNAAETTE